MEAPGDIWERECEDFHFDREIELFPPILALLYVVVGHEVVLSGWVSRGVSAWACWMRVILCG